MTQDEYDALPSAEKLNPDKVFFITDAGGGGGGGSSTLAGLTDVDLSNPTNGQVLKYNATTQKWENANESGGGGSAYSETALWSGSESMFSTIQILLDDAYTNYDALRFAYTVTRGDNIVAHYEKTVSVDTISIAQAANEQFAISDFFLYSNAGVAVYGTVVSTTELSSVYVSRNWFKACVLNKVVGIKY